MTAARADPSQQFGDLPDQASLGAENLPVDIRDLTFADRYGDDGFGVVVDGGAEPGIYYRQRPHALRRLLGGGRIVRQQCRSDTALRLKQCRRDHRIGGVGDRRIELFAQPRQPDDQFGTTRDQRRNALDTAAIGRQSRRDAVDHVLLLGGELEAGLLQNFTQRGGGFPDLTGLRAWIGHEVPGGKPQFVHPAIDVFGQVANALQPLQLGKRRIDVADSDDAGDAGDHDHGQHQQKTAECKLTDRQRERSYPLDDSGNWHEYRTGSRQSFYIRRNWPQGEHSRNVTATAAQAGWRRSEGDFMVIRPLTDR